MKVSVFEKDGKVETSTESAPDDAKKVAKFKVDLENWTVIAMPKTEDLEMAVKFQYKDAKPEDAKSVDAFPLDKAAQTWEGLPPVSQFKVPSSIAPENVIFNASTAKIQTFALCIFTTFRSLSIR